MNISYEGLCYRDYSGFTKSIGVNTITQVGRGTPFINVSFSGLLWGYNDELPCNSLTRPSECPAAPDEVDIFSQDSDDDEDDDEEDDWDWKRKKRDISGKA